MSDFMQLMEKWDGYVPVSTAKISEAEVAKFLDLVSNAARMPAHRRDYLLREVITTTEFPSLFGFTLERDILARYRAATAEWRAYCKVGTLPNFNQAELHKVQGQDGLLPRVDEKGEYLVSPSVNAHYHRQVFKYGRQFDISWEATINDILGAFDDIPARFADAVTYTRAYNVTSLLAASTGPHTSLFGATISDVDGQAVTNSGSLALTVANLQTTLGLMAAQTDVNGRPLGIRGKHLIVPPALEITARQILTSALVAYVEDSTSGVVPMPTTNVLPQMGIQMHVDPLLPIVDTSSNNDGTWYVLADPAQGAAIQMDFLRGYEDPEICMKSSDKVALGGGLLNAMSGDFATDNILYRVRDVHGGAQLDPRYAYAQVHT